MKKLFIVGLLVFLVSAFVVSAVSAAPAFQDDGAPADFPGLAIVIGGVSVGAAIIFPVTQLLKKLGVPDGTGGIVAIVLAAVAAFLVQLGLDVPSVGAMLPDIVQWIAELLDLVMKFLSIAGGSLLAFRGGRAMLPGRV